MSQQIEQENNNKEATCQKILKIREHQNNNAVGKLKQGKQHAVIDIE